MQQNNKKCNWPREDKEFKLTAEAWNCSMYAWIAGWGVYLKCGQLVFPVATKYGKGDNMMLSFTSNVIVPLLFGGNCTESGYVLILKGVLTFVVEDHRGNDRRHVVTDIHFLCRTENGKIFIQIRSRMEAFNSPEVLHLLWDP